jgi:arsenate reductase
VVIHHPKTGWTRPQLLALLAAAGLTPRAELGLLEADVDEQTPLDAMLEHPVLFNRPLVATPRGVDPCQPSETVLRLLENMPPGPLAKEDGELIIDD